MKYLQLILKIIVLPIFLIGCASNPTIVEPSSNEKLTELLRQGGLITEESDRGVVVYLPALFFKYGSATLLEDVRDKVRYIADAVNQDFALNRRVVVEGHADSNGTEAYNLALSEKRAISVTDELVFSNVEPTRIDTAWFGESVPFAPNENADGSDNPDGRAKNRRVEFIILDPTAE